MSDSSDRPGEADAGDASAPGAVSSASDERASSGPSTAPLSRAELRAAREREAAAAAGTALAAAAEAAKEEAVEAALAAEAARAAAQAAEDAEAARAERTEDAADPAQTAGSAVVDAPQGVAVAPIPDQIAPRHYAGSRPRPVDRPPEPIVYRPVSSAYVGELAPPLPEPTARNVPARIALVLIPLAALGGASVVLWWERTSPTVAGVVALVSLTLAVAAFFLAIGGLVVAVQRPTKKRTSILALVLALLVVAWLGVITVTQALAIVR